MPSPACCVISSTGTSGPECENNSRALATSRSRLRRASLLSAFGAATGVLTFEVCQKAERALRFF